MRTDLLGRRRARSRFSSLWEFALFVVVLFFVFLAVVDLAVTRGDDRLMRDAATETAAALAAPPDDVSDDVSAAAAAHVDDARNVEDLDSKLGCEPVGLRTVDADADAALPADAVCLVKLGVQPTGGAARVRIERGEDAVIVCVMMEARSVTGLLGPVQRDRTLRTVAEHGLDVDDRGGVWVASERPLAGADWDFCPAGRSGDDAS